VNSAAVPTHAHARVVIVGGGVIGCSIAYHLVKLGCSEVGGAAPARPLQTAFRGSLPAILRDERAVRTASSEQVRQPIYRDAVEHWRNFEPQLQELRSALGTALTDYPYQSLTDVDPHG
jgi:glycine/D-amino acid oxidase-like deaminating enzyme